MPSNRPSNKRRDRGPTLTGAVDVQDFCRIFFLLFFFYFFFLFRSPLPLFSSARHPPFFFSFSSFFLFSFGLADPRPRGPRNRPSTQALKQALKQARRPGSDAHRSRGCPGLFPDFFFTFFLLFFLFRSPLPLFSSARHPQKKISFFFFFFLFCFFSFFWEADLADPADLADSVPEYARDAREAA